jgi:hypothetical protein
MTELAGVNEEGEATAPDITEEMEYELSQAKSHSQVATQADSKVKESTSI